MPYTWWGDPISILQEMQRRQRDLAQSPREVAGVYPAVNIYDDGESFMIRAELPGIDKTKLDITSKGNRVSIRGGRQEERGSVDAAYHRRERDMGVFHRVVVLPEHVDAAKTTATYRNGVLEVVCPRAESAKAHRVEIA